MSIQSASEILSQSPERSLWLGEALQSPLYFSIVREDSDLDLKIVRRLKAARVLMVASGGCTAALLAASGVLERLTLVDCNPAQIALSRLKLDLVQNTSPADRLKILGHERMPAEDRSKVLKKHFDRLEIAADALGSWEQISLCGPDFVGRYEHLFAALRFELQPCKNQLSRLLSLSDPGEQSCLLSQDVELGEKIDSAFKKIMALPNLVSLFGGAATANPLQPFDRHFCERTRFAFATFSARSNPYMQQIFAGLMPRCHPLPWLSASPYMMPTIDLVQSEMGTFLSCTGENYDYVHLSNILDWLSPEQASTLLRSAASVLSPGGHIFIRQLNSAIDIKSLGHQFDWSASEGLMEKDRSFFYRALFLGKKQ